MPIDDQQAGGDRGPARRLARDQARHGAALESILYERFDVLDHGFVRVIDYMGDDSAIVQAARVSYGAGTRHVREDRALIRYLLRHRHTTPFEMCELKLHIKAPIFVARQWLRHRTASVNEYSARYSRLDREFYVPDAAHLQSVHEEKDRPPAGHQQRHGRPVRGREAGGRRAHRRSPRSRAPTSRAGTMR